LDEEAAISEQETDWPWTCSLANPDWDLAFLCRVCLPSLTLFGHDTSGLLRFLFFDTEIGIFDNLDDSSKYSVTGSGQTNSE
jgi:hypothetical protein